MTRPVALGVLVFGSLLWGCTAGPQGTAQAPIFGGAETTAHPEVGMLVFDGGFVCSTVLVGPRTALTAAHCVHAFAADPGVLGVAFAAATTAPSMEQTVSVVDLHLAPEYETNSAHDLAVLELGADAPVAPVPYRTATVTSGDVDSTVRIVGFGLTSVDDDPSDRRRRVAEVVLDEVDGVLMRWFSDEAGLCYGDSGGAVFLSAPGGMELAGVAVEGDANCEDRGVGVRTDAFVNFLADPQGAGDDDDVRGIGDDDDDTTTEQTTGCGGGQTIAGLWLLPPLMLRRRRVG